MRKMMIALIIAVTVCLCCRYYDVAPYADSVLPALTFDVPVNRDTTITTANGMKIEVPAGALQAGGAYARIVVKEAFKLSQMVRGKLITKTGKDVLSSGGMFYVGAGAKDVKLVKPITVWLPTPNQVPGMQLYKGNATTDGTVDWVDPIPLPGPPKTEDLEKGRVLYQQNCASCHSTTRKSTGPALAFIDQRRDWQWLRNWVANSAAMIADGDRLAVGIYDIYNKTVMTCFPDLTDEQLHLIFEYANYEARDIDPNTIPDYKKILDSCDRYCESLSGRKMKQSPPLVPYTSSEWYQEWRKTRHSVTNPQDTTLEQHLNYKINVFCFGWYNVDILTKNLSGFDSSILTINTALAGNTNLTVSILLPGQKILLQGWKMPNHPDTYVFCNDDGTIPLPQNEKAIVFAFGIKDSKDFFGVTEFVTSRTNQYSIAMQPSSQQNIDQWLAGLDTLRLMDPIAAMLPLADTGKIEIDSTSIELLKPKGYHCHCATYNNEEPYNDFSKFNQVR